MRPGITAAQISAISAHRVQYATLLDVDFPNDPARLHGGWGWLTVSGRDYIGSGLLGSVSEARENTGGRVSGASYQLSGVATPEGTAIVEKLEETAYNDTIEVTLGFAIFNPVTGAAIGPPINLRADYLDGAGRSHTASGAVLTVTAEPPGLDRSVRGARRISSADQKREYPDDTAAEKLANIGVIPLVVRFDT